MKKILDDFPMYTVDRLGNVWSFYTRQFVKHQQQARNGYVYVTLYNKGKCRRVLLHRLVAETYLSNPFNLPCVNHKDENKLNNSVDNLEWCNHKYNNQYGKAPTRMATCARKRPVNQYDAAGKLIATYESACEAERVTGIHQSNISKCCLGRKNFRSAGSYKWRFSE